MNVTPWFDMQSPPTRRGVYEIGHGDWQAFSYWDGYRWYGWSGDPVEAYYAYREVGQALNTLFDGCRWRGIDKRSQK